jgi:antitoxin CptB
VNPGPPAVAGLDAQREFSRLRWRCRRGMRELDELLVRYLEHDYGASSARERAAFERLLELQDPELLGYLVGRQTPPGEDQQHVVARLRRDPD